MEITETMYTAVVHTANLHSSYCVLVIVLMTSHPLSHLLQPYKGGTIIMPFIQMRRLRSGQVPNWPQVT